jgi:hypothetical protein
MVCGRQHKQRFWNELCFSQMQAMTSWRSTNKTVCVTCYLGTEVVVETHTYYRFLGSRIWSELQ